MYMNDGEGNFVNVAADQPQLQCATVRTKGTAFADVDNDGDLDLYVINWGAENKLYMNNQNDGNFVKIAGLGFGTKVALYDGEQLVGTREIKSATGFCAQEPAVAHFGVEAGKAYTAKVTAPGSETVSLVVKAGQAVNVQ